MASCLYDPSGWIWKNVTPVFGPWKRSPSLSNAIGLPRIEFEIFTFVMSFSTSARLVLPSAHEFEMAIAIISRAVKVGGPNPSVCPYSLVKVARYGFATGTALTSAPKYDKYAPGNLKFVGSKLRRP